MLQYDYGFTLFLLTILITRTVLFLWPIPSPTINRFRIHHWMYGAGLVVLSLFISSVSLYAIGLGLFVDELTFVIIGGKTHVDNYSITSLFGLAGLTIVAYAFRNHLFSVI